MTQSQPDDFSNLSVLRARLADNYRADEAIRINEILAQVSLTQKQTHAITKRATKLVKTVRKNRTRFGGLDKFLQEFGLTTKEGIALMCLAEALLRIPDSKTADALIKDKIATADWDQHIGKGDDLFINASTWALMLTGKVLGDTSFGQEDKPPSSLLGKMISRAGEPVIRNAVRHTMKILGRQFVMGRTIDEALKRAKEDEQNGYTHSFDMLGEGARTAEDALRYFNSYKAAIEAIGNATEGKNPVTSSGISVKLSALHPRYTYTQSHRCVPELTEKLLSLAKLAAQYDIGLTVDAEEADRLELSLDIIENVFTSPDLGNWDGFGLAVQAYQKRCPELIDWLIALSQTQGRRMMIRLVKGAYWDSEIKWAQEGGQKEYPVWTRKASTDCCYIACAEKLLAARDSVYPQFATHNARTVATVIELAGKDQHGFEFQRLHGMGEPLYHQLVGKDQYPCRIYAPVGGHEDLLAYLVRRLLENGANTSFVNRIQDDSVPIEEIIADPITIMKELEHKPHPHIPLPEDIFGDTRKNSSGLDLHEECVVTPLLDHIKQVGETHEYAAAPIINGKLSPNGEAMPIHNPANLNETVGTITQATENQIDEALTLATAAFPKWSATPATERAACLNRAADLLEDNQAELLSLIIREGGRTLDDAVSELREAVDFCRYYATEGEKLFAPHPLPGPTGESNQLSLHGRGVFLCISPWNFPLAIFTGQIAAALMAGNCVIAKPAAQTPLIAMRAIQILHEAGIPPDALTFMPGPGCTIGAKLVDDPRIAGIAMTGSTETARTINQQLSQRQGPIVPLIAETGGQNAMIVDSSALPEQVTDDIITSAFKSAGQRCSALRVLYLQEGIADKILSMLSGAMAELVMGNPQNIKTDIGPVIDEKQLKELEDHAKTFDKPLAQTPLPIDLARGHYFAPRVFDIPGIDHLNKENFGPILHVVRYKAEDLDTVIDDINATGFGLTLGIHTRIDHIRDHIIARARVGNIYVNRSIIGAVVGVQPFGGQGLSGTGPKAGGPYYLQRFATEKTVTIDTTASGGNTTLVNLAET